MNIKRRIKSLIVFSLVVLSMSLIVPAIQSQADPTGFTAGVVGGNGTGDGQSAGNIIYGTAGASQESCGYRMYLLYAEDDEHYMELKQKYNQRDEHGAIKNTPPAGLEHLRYSTLNLNWNAYNLYGVVDILWQDPGSDPYANQPVVYLRDQGIKSFHRSTVKGGVTVYKKFPSGMPRPYYYDNSDNKFHGNGQAFYDWMLEMNHTYGVQNAIYIVGTYFGPDALDEFLNPDIKMFLSVEPITWHQLSNDHNGNTGVYRNGKPITVYGTFAQWLLTYEWNSGLNDNVNYPDHGYFTEVLDNDVLGLGFRLSHIQPELRVDSLSPDGSTFLTGGTKQRTILSFVHVECLNGRAKNVPTLSRDNNTLGWHLYYNQDFVVDNSTHTWDYEKEIEAEAPDPSKEDPGEYEKLPEEDKQYIIVKSYRLRNEDTGELTDRGTFIREETVGKIRIEDEELKEYSYKVKAWATSSGEINRLIKSSKWEEGIPREVGERGDGESTVVLFFDSWIS